MTKPVIKPITNGPFEVRFLENLRDVDGNPIELPRKEDGQPKAITLCRCGSSARMPFCDGTHRRIHFNSARIDRPENDECLEYRSGKITIHDNRAICTGAGYCVRGLPQVFRKGQKPWIDASAAEVDQIMSVVRQCPSGALSYSFEGEKFMGPEREPLIQMRKDGPYDVQGGIELLNADFCQGASREHYQLCRCGFSKNKPFCDGMHWQVGYEDAKAAHANAGDTGDADGGSAEEEHEPQPAISVSDIIVKTMINWGVTHVFGMVGGTILGVADSVRRHAEAGELHYIGIRHEGAAAFACSGFAKLSGRPAACLTIAGPGATNLMTGLWDAKADRIPVLALTGQVGMQQLVPGAFQEIDLEDAFQAVTVFSETVMPGSPHAEITTLALKNAVIERGVAHLIIPSEVQEMPAAGGNQPSRPYGRVEPDSITPPEESMREAISRIGAAQRPAIIVGNGARHAMDKVIALAERLGSPMITTYKAMGQVDNQHKLSAGMIGMSGMPVAFHAMSEADLLIAFGCSFSEHSQIDMRKEIIQVDFDRMALGRAHPVAVPVWGDTRVSAALMLEGLPEHIEARDQSQEVADQWRKWRERKRQFEERDSGHGLSPAAVIAVLNRLVPEDAVVAVDVGNNTSSFGRYFECRRQTVLLSGYLGAVGFAFPAAMGAWAAEPRRKTIVVAGDGGFAQYMAEFSTAVKYSMDITVIVLNNFELGMISDEQKHDKWPIWETALHNPDFAQFARSCAGFGERVEERADLEEAIAGALAYEGPALVDVKTDPRMI